MSLIHMAWRYLWNRKMVTILTLVGIALGAALISTVLTLRRESQQAFAAEGTIYDLVVGAKGSPLQLVMSSVYFMDLPNGNIPSDDYEALKKNPAVSMAVPIGLGDNYHGFRIVGTNNDIFKIKSHPSTKLPKPNPVLKVAEGKEFSESFETVLGSEAARITHLKIGDPFVGTHGLSSAAGSDEHKKFPYKVVGILAPSGTSLDRGIFTTLDSTWKIHDDENVTHGAQILGMSGRAGGAAAQAAAAAVSAAGPRQVTSVLMQLRFVGARESFKRTIDTTTGNMAAIPVVEMAGLFKKVLEPMQMTLLGVAALVVVVAGLTILTTLYQAAERRRRDIAVMRALGAHPREVFALVLMEAMFLTLLGLGGGWVLGHGLLAAAGPIMRDRLGMSIYPWSIDNRELIALATVAVVGFVAGVVPAVLAYRRAPAGDLAAV